MQQKTVTRLKREIVFHTPKKDFQKDPLEMGLFYLVIILVSISYLFCLAINRIKRQRREWQD
jgi:hypothetical protein